MNACIRRTIIPFATFLFTFAPFARSQQVTRIPATDKNLAGAPANQFAIGAEDGEDWELLSRVSGVAFDTSDNLYVLDAGNSRVLVFDAKGKFVRKIGKKGGGPGELLVPTGLAFTRDGYIAVTDIGRPGVSLFRPDGSFVKNLMMGDSLGMPIPQSGVYAHPTGGVVVRSNPMFGGRIQTGNVASFGGPTGPRVSPITWFNASGQTEKLFAIDLPSLTPKVENSGGGNVRNVTVRVSMPAFTPPVLWGVLPNGSVAIANEADYRVKITTGGKVTRVIERAFPPRKVTERDKDKAREQRRKNMKTGTGMMIATRTEGGAGGSRSNISTGGAGAPRMSDAEIEQAVREMTFLDYVPALQRMLIDAKGRMWIQRTGKEVGTDGPIDIIDANGTYVGSVNGKLPDAISATGRAAYIEKDDMDVEKVVVRKLPASWM